MADSVQIKRVNWWHERLADWMLANPGARLTDAAKYFNKTLTWVSIVKNSDAFKHYYAARSASYSTKVEDGSVLMIMGVAEKNAALAELALDNLIDRVSTQGCLLSVEQLSEIADAGLKRMGYGANKNSQPPQIQVGVSVAVDREDLARAREKVHLAYGVQANVELAQAGSSAEPLAIEAQKQIEGSND